MNVAINEAVLTDLILDKSGLGCPERLMVLTAMGTSTKVDDVEKALIKMHSHIRTFERKSSSKGEQEPEKERVAFRRSLVQGGRIF